MKERPILFSEPMVRAILVGRKTQTRRVVKPQPNRGSELTRMQDGYADGFIRAVFAQDDEPNAYGIKCPFGERGDRLLAGNGITLEITSVRVDRLQYISDFDAYQEGAPSKAGTITGPYCMSYKEGFRALWESIHGPGSWGANPWVWVLEFKRVEGEK